MSVDREAASRDDAAERTAQTIRGALWHGQGLGGHNNYRAAENALGGLLALLRIEEAELAAARAQIEWHKATKQALMDAHEAAVRRERTLREALAHVVNDSPGTPESVKSYLRAALASTEEQA